MFETQIHFIEFIQQARTPFLDGCMRLCDYLDRQEFLFIFIPIIWLGISWQAGLRLFYLLGLNHMVNYGLKSLFCLPRPFHLDPVLGLIQVRGYGFPSGAAQAAILLSGLLILHVKGKWKWWIAPTYVLLLSFSRVYLGVHFPLDILGGWAVGLLLLGLYFSLFPKIEGFFQKRSPLQTLILTQSILLLVIMTMPPLTIFSLSTCAMGLATGLYINNTCHIEPTLPQSRSLRGGLGKLSTNSSALMVKNPEALQGRVLQSPEPLSKVALAFRILIGILGVFLIHTVATKLFPEENALVSFFQFYLIGIWISSLALVFSNKLSGAIDFH